MDPAHLVSPPRAHPSGSAEGGHLDEASLLHHHRRYASVVQEPWFMMLVATALVVVLFGTAGATIFLRHRHQMRSSKAIGHTSGKFNGSYFRKLIFIYEKHNKSSSHSNGQ